MEIKQPGKFDAPGRDRTRRSVRVGWEFVYWIVDDCSQLAHSEVRVREVTVLNG
jgi:hypothetical protein